MSPVLLIGNTHEDVDGIFGVERKYLEQQSFSTVEELVHHLQSALKHHPLPVFVNVIRGTLDFDAYFEGSVDPKLRNFRTQHNNWNPGAHFFRFL
jgi:hypothetical protein